MPVRPDPAAFEELDARRLGPEVVERYLRRHGLGARKRYSQNHLVDGEVLDDIVIAASPSAERHILDIPVAQLVEPPYELVANLPYHITSPVLHHVLDRGPRPERFVLMLQREIAERVAAPPGAMSYVSVFVQYHARVHVRRIVPPSSFEPAPDVSSAVLVGETIPRRLAVDAERQLWRLVQAAFRERRKMLHNVLPRQLPSVGLERFDAALARAGVAPDRRPQTVSVDEWLAI